MNYTLTYLSAISEIEEKIWDGIAADSTPFMRHAFLHALETSGCVQLSSGWQPNHMVIQQDDVTIAVLPLYIKYHSYGEYVFDQEWARAYQQYGMRYYPKLLSAIPFTPVTGPRLVSQMPELPEHLFVFVAEQIRLLCDAHTLSTWHCLFTPASQARSWQGLPLLRRRGVQFHWLNKGYTTFDDFLATMNSKKRKTIKRERRRVLEQAIQHTWIQAGDMSDSDWLDFYQCYSSTYLKRGQTPYLNLKFFQKLSETMPDYFLCLFAKQENKLIASALFCVDDSTCLLYTSPSPRD